MTFLTLILLIIFRYKKWASERGLNEKMIPGLHLTNEQTVFLAHAQTQCYNRDDYAGYFRALRGNTEEDVKVNSALGQVSRGDVEEVYIATAIAVEVVVMLKKYILPRL